MGKIELAPSILSANFAQLGVNAKAALDAGGSVLHVDVMDGHFVPNITIGPPVVKSLRKALPDAIFDAADDVAWRVAVAAVGQPFDQVRATIP